MAELIEVDPAGLYLPPSRAQGADPRKLAAQISKFGSSLEGMPPLQLVQGGDGRYRINDGVTRATRAAKLRPGVLLRAEVIQVIPKLKVDRTPTVKEMLP